MNSTLPKPKKVLSVRKKVTLLRIIAAIVNSDGPIKKEEANRISNLLMCLELDENLIQRELKNPMKMKLVLANTKGIKRETVLPILAIAYRLSANKQGIKKTRLQSIRKVAAHFWSHKSADKVLEWLYCQNRMQQIELEVALTNNRVRVA